MLKIKDLAVSVEGKEIIHDVNLTIHSGETHVLFGPNGAGKSTLLMSIMGFPKYTITRGSIRGVKTRDMIAACLKQKGDSAEITRLADMADMRDFLERDINYGFSGGEIKRSELMQLLAQKPQLTLLDEPESGVDLVNIALIGRLMNDLLEKNCPIQYRKCMGLIITHTGHILDYVNARTGYVMCDGTIGCVGDPHEILNTIRERGYDECIKCYLGRVPAND
jgi:Fe-S cluster assembly ATP-binding protein